MSSILNSAVSPPIEDIRLDAPIFYMQAVGDTWDPAWAGDGSLYMPGNDGSGWDQACRTNVFFNRIVGDDFERLNGQTTNNMPEYGGWAEKGHDGCTWKSSGCLSLDGALYFGVARHMYGTDSGDPAMRQTAARASIIKSEDGGRTWSRSAEENYADPMFPDGRFATPYFIHYRQDGKTHPVDGADRFVYAISNNGFWCNGDDYILGRVRKDKLGNLDPRDWSFYRGIDGAEDGSWTENMHQAEPIIANSRKCGETGATYIPALGRYLLIAWYYPGNPNVETDETHLIFYESPKPWGPWREVQEVVSSPEGWYCPRVLSKWQVSQGDEVSAVIATGGDYYEMDKYYRFTLVPLLIKTGGRFPPPPPEPKPLVVPANQVGKDENEFTYQGAWVVHPEHEKSEYFSAQAGDSFTLAFTGRRIKWFARKVSTSGIVAVSLGGGDEVMIDQYTYCTVPQYGRLLYDSGELPIGKHTLTVRVTGNKNPNSKGTGVYNNRVEIFR